MKSTTRSRWFVSAAFVLTIFLTTATVFSQINQVDPTYRPVPSIPPPLPDTGAPNKGQVIQPDGKIIVWGGRLAVRGSAKGQIARLNSDGSLDQSFSYCSCHLEGLTNIALQPDGKLLVAGYDTSFKAKVVRLNPDGSADPSYTTAFPASPSGTSRSFIWLVRGDGKAYVEFFQSAFGFASRAIYRLNQDGSTDTSLTPISSGGGQSIQTFPADFLEYSGKLYLVLNSMSLGGSSTDLRRFNLDGTLDSAWERPVISSNSIVSDILFQPDGSLILSGRFNSVNGFSKMNLARVLPAGNVDLAFTGPSAIEGGSIKLLTGGKFLWSPMTDISGERTFYRLNNDGSIDPTFMDPPSLVLRATDWDLDATERIYFYGADAKFHRLNPNGDVDFAYAPAVDEFGQVHSLARRPDGKLYIGGVFTQMNGEARPAIARVNADGSHDNTFNPGTGFDQPPTRMVAQPDGKVLAMGPFNSYDGAARTGIIRINTDGTLDTGFVANVADVRTAVVQADGKIIIGGAFTSVNGTGRTYLARLLSDGNLDNSFAPVIGGCCGIEDVLIQPDGKIMIAGNFSGVDGFARPSLARLTATGSLDTTFNASGIGTTVRFVRLQASGKYVVVGHSTIIRRNTDGSADASFPSLLFEVSSGQLFIDAAVMGADGSLIVGGRFDTVNSKPRRNFLRVSANGVFDQLFFPRGANGRVRSIADDGAGKVIVGGDFWKFSDVVRAGIARLDVTPFRKVAPFDFDGDGRADVAVLRPSTNIWYELFSSNGSVAEETFGTSGDLPAPADFDGDGITDEAIFRPSTGTWWYKSSIDSSQRATQFGASGDIPRPSDFDGDGKADFVLFRPSTNQWFRLGSSGQNITSVFGLAGDQPLVGDFDGDGKSDLAIFRPSSGDWWYAASSAGGAFRAVHWGQNGDIPVPADYDGDGKTDNAIFRPSDGGWYIYNSSDGSFTIMAFGTNGDRPAAGDYDGDGKADIAVFRPSTGIWYLFQSTSGFAGLNFGISTDVALAGSLLP